MLYLTPQWGTNGNMYAMAPFVDLYIKVKFNTYGPVRIYPMNGHTADEIYDERNPIFIDTES